MLCCFLRALLVISVLGISACVASHPESDSGWSANLDPEAPDLNHYYSVNDTENIISLNRWTSYPGMQAIPRESYDRLKHFGTWISKSVDQTCLNTRARVLIRDSVAPVIFSEKNHCRVVAGEWNDSYSGKTFTDARDIQIDHFVPLKNAYSSGGWKWTPSKRCAYANFMGNNYHLIPVSGFENMSKSDSSPQYYLPPNTGFVCEYLSRWLKVKLIWRMTMSGGEAKAIQGDLQKYHCDVSKMTMSQPELEHQRLEILQHESACDARRTSKARAEL